MELWIVYVIVALSIALTSYWNVYKPALSLYKEITEDESPMVGSFIYKIVWILLSTAAAPLIAIMLLKGRNDNYIRDLVVTWIDQDEDE